MTPLIFGVESFCRSVGIEQFCQLGSSFHRYLERYPNLSKDRGAKGRKPSGHRSPGGRDFTVNRRQSFAQKSRKRREDQHFPRRAEVRDLEVHQELTGVTQVPAERLGVRDFRIVSQHHFAGTEALNRQIGESGCNRPDRRPSSFSVDAGLLQTRSVVRVPQSSGMGRLPLANSPGANNRCYRTNSLDPGCGCRVLDECGDIAIWHEDNGKGRAHQNGDVQARNDDHGSKSKHSYEAATAEAL
jgi:hypothetical protein